MNAARHYRALPTACLSWRCFPAKTHACYQPSQQGRSIFVAGVWLKNPSWSFLRVTLACRTFVHRLHSIPHEKNVNRFDSLNSTTGKLRKWLSAYLRSSIVYGGPWWGHLRVCQLVVVLVCQPCLGPSPCLTAGLRVFQPHRRSTTMCNQALSPSISSVLYPFVAPSALLCLIVE